MDGTFSTHEGFGKVVKYPDRKRSLGGDILVDGKIMLKRALKTYSVRVWPGFNLLRLGANDRVLYHANELSGSVTGNLLAN